MCSLQGFWCVCLLLNPCLGKLKDCHERCAFLQLHVWLTHMLVDETRLAMEAEEINREPKKKHPKPLFLALNEMEMQSPQFTVRNALQEAVFPALRNIVYFIRSRFQFWDVCPHWFIIKDIRSCITKAMFASVITWPSLLFKRNTVTE